MLRLNFCNRGIDSFDLLCERAVEVGGQSRILLDNEVFDGCHETEPFIVALVLNALELGIHDNCVHSWQPSNFI